MVSLTVLLPFVPVLALDAIIPISNSNDDANGIAVVQDTVTAVFTGPTLYITGNDTYNIAGPTTLVITDCPCTLSSAISEEMSGIQTAKGSAPTSTASNTTLSSKSSSTTIQTISTSTKANITAVSTNGASRPRILFF